MGSVQKPQNFLPNMSLPREVVAVTVSVQDRGLFAQPVPAAEIVMDCAGKTQ